MLDVDFEWFDPQPIDFHGLKTLLRQLFDVDAQLFELSALVDLILSQPTLGSTVKVDGNETDPYAFLTVLNLHEHRENPAISTLIKYFSSKSSSSPNLTTLPTLLSPSSDAQVGLILCERFINMPSQIVPPMYTMLLEEMNWALEEKEPYNFTHYLIVSKTYKEVESKLESLEIDDRPSKKKKGAQKRSGSSNDTFFFHPEDEVLQKHASGWGDFTFTKEGDDGASDSRRAFQEMGVKPSGHMILIEGGKFEAAVKAVAEYLSAG